MTKLPEFKSINDAEETVKEQVLSLCDIYSKTITQVLPTLNRSASASSIPLKDRKVFEDLHTEGQDHLHNLNQLKKELEQLEKTSRSAVLEVCAEVLSNTIQYLNTVPKAIEKTDFYNKTT